MQQSEHVLAEMGVFMKKQHAPGEDASRRRVLKRFLQVTLFYGAFLFLFFFTEYAAMNRASVLLIPQRSRLLHALIMLSSAAGYAAFGLCSRGLRVYRRRRLMLIAVTLVYFVSVQFVLVSNAASLWALTLIATCSCSYLGGAAHYYASYALCGTTYSGRAAGAALAIASIGQNLLMGVHDNHILSAVALGLSAAAFALLLLNPTRYWRLADVVMPRAEAAVWAKRKQPPMFLLCALFALLVLTSAIGNSTLIAMYTEGTLQMTMLPRFAFAAAALLAGVLFDLKNRSILPVYLLTMVILSLMGYLFLGWQEGQMVYVALVYIFSGTYMLCGTVAFLELAPDTRCPHQWAGMGRLLRACILGVTGLLLNEPVAAMAEADALPALQLFAALPALGALWVAVMKHKTFSEKIWPAMAEARVCTAAPGVLTAPGSADMPAPAVASQDSAAPGSADAAAPAHASADSAALEHGAPAIACTEPAVAGEQQRAAAPEDPAAPVDTADAALPAQTTEPEAGSQAQEPDASRTPEADAAADGGSEPGGELGAFIRQFQLTAREAEVLAAVLESDGTIRMLADELHISERMVYRHLSSIYEKTNTNSRATLVRMYYRQEWKELPR